MASRAYLRAGDYITLRSCKSKELLVIKQQTTGNGILRNKLCTTGGNEGYTNVWQVSMAGVPCLPEWNINRPFLNGKFLIDNEISNGNLNSNSNLNNITGNNRKSFEASPKVLELLFKNTRGDTYENSYNQKPSKNDLLSLPNALQEKLLIDDLLSVFMGMEGVYIHIDNESNKQNQLKTNNTSNRTNDDTSVPMNLLHVKFMVENADISLTQLVNRMLPCGEFVVKIKAYVMNKSRYEYGMVNHALCSSLNVLIKEFNVLIAQVNLW